MNKDIINKVLDKIYFLLKISLVLIGVYVGIIYLYFMIISISNPSIFEKSLIVIFNAMIIILLIVWFSSYCDNKKINNSLVNKIYKTINPVLYFTSIIGCFFLTFILMLVLSEVFICFTYNEPISIVEVLVVIIIPLFDLIMSRLIFNKKIKYIFYLYAIIFIVFSCFYNLQTNDYIIETLYRIWYNMLH